MSIRKDLLVSSNSSPDDSPSSEDAPESSAPSDVRSMSKLLACFSPNSMAESKSSLVAWWSLLEDLRFEEEEVEEDADEEEEEE